MLLAILILGIGWAAAQNPGPCQSPQQFEAKFLTKDFSKNFTQYGRILYDETNRRIREVEELIIGDATEMYDTLYFFNEKKEYRVNLRDRKCNTTTLNQPFVPFGVPPSARFEGSATVGPVNIPSEHMDVNSFKGETAEGAYYFDVMTGKYCLPVSVEYFSNSTGVVHRTFFDATSGIADPEAFTIPRECTL